MKSESTKLAFVALYPSDYLADTAHLGLLEHGIYWRLLLHYYQHGQPLPGDTERLARIISAMTPEEKRTLEYILPEYFHLENMPDGTRKWVHHRADLEIARAHEVYEMKKSRAQKGAETRWSKEKQEHGENDDTEKMLKQCLSNAQAYPQAMLKDASSICLSNAIQNQNHIQNQNQNKSTEPDSSSPPPANPGISPSCQGDKDKNLMHGAQKNALHAGRKIHELPLIDKDGVFYPQAEDVLLWQETYPAVDVMFELGKMRSWIDANPTKRKTAKGIRKFINGWLGRCQDNGGSHKPATNGNGGPRDKVAAAYERSAAFAEEFKAKLRQQTRMIDGECHEV